MRQFVVTVLIPRMVRRFGVAPASRSMTLLGQRLQLLRELRVDAVLDVGANVGQYAKELRASGFAGSIYSFEPGREAVEELRRASRSDGNWHVEEIALGAESGTATLTVWPDASTLASTRSPVPGLIDYFGEPLVENVRVVALADWLARAKAVDARRTLLKIDVQGSEGEVLAGAGDSLQEFALVEVEAPLGEWYSGEATIVEILRMLEAAGFQPATIMTQRFVLDWRGAADVDILFIRKDLSRVPR